jgi:putative hemolysin
MGARVSPNPAAKLAGIRGAMERSSPQPSSAKPSSAQPSFSYASQEVGPASRLVIRTIEAVTGQPKIRRIYQRYTKRRRPPQLFWADALASLKLTIRSNRTPAECIPRSGPLVMIANHPFGVVDGIILCWMAAQIRDDYQIMTHRVLHQAPEIRDHILPVDFSGTRAAQESNVASRQAARELLARGGLLVVFPSGGVALSHGLLNGLRGKAIDLEWKVLAAGLVLGSKADVLPMFFYGQNSRLYQIAGNLRQTLKLSLLFHEVANKIGKTIDLRVGDLIPNATLQAIGDRQKVIDFLRETTHGLGRLAPEPRALAQEGPDAANAITSAAL